MTIQPNQIAQGDKPIASPGQLREGRRYPIGAELIGDGRVSFRLWAPKAQRVELVIEKGNAGGPPFHEMRAEEGGYFSAATAAEAGTQYLFRLDGEGMFYPDPASRSQPEGPHGASCVIDPAPFSWTDRAWTGRKLHGQIVYEMHVGTFTREGTWAAAARELPELIEAGITVIEMMPIADFSGTFGWGYDGVNMFAPSHLYGAPDDLRRFLDAAHAAGMAVILDVVFNHFGPDGNYLGRFSDDYITDRYETDWGDPLNFDGKNSAPVREFFLTNARYWIEEFHFDGFRFDATQSIFDQSTPHIVAEIGMTARAAGAGREIILIAENEPQDSQFVRPLDQGGHGLDAIWNDDLHHTAIVALTGRDEAYYTDYRGTPQEFISAAKYGCLFQGQYYRWQTQPRGVPSLRYSPQSFVGFLENHDQVSNSASGLRVRAQTSPGKYRALTVLILLGPWTPMLFQGQEFGATTPFLYFTDIGGDLREAIRNGRTEFLAQFPTITDKETQERIAIPSEPDTFARCKLNFEERATNKPIYDLHKDLIKLRRADACFSAQARGGVDGAVLTESALLLRYFGEEGDDRLLIVNLGRRRELAAVPEPLLAPPANTMWTTLWSSETPRYGGPGVVPVVTRAGWTLPAEAAVVLVSKKRRPRKKP